MLCNIERAVVTIARKSIVLINLLIRYNYVDENNTQVEMKYLRLL